MAAKSVNGHTDPKSTSVPYIDLAFDVHSPDTSVLKLIYRVRPKWRDCSEELKITKFTDGITNTVCNTTCARARAQLTWRSYSMLRGIDLVLFRAR